MTSGMAAGLVSWAKPTLELTAKTPAAVKIRLKVAHWGDFEAWEKW